MAKLLARVIFFFSTSMMFEGKAFPAPYMLGWLAGSKPWSIADIRGR